jgi:hypothetical protein
MHVKHRVDVESNSLQEPMEDVVMDIVVVDGNVDSVRAEQIGSVRRIEPAELKWKLKLPKVISSPSLRACLTGPL